MKARDLESGDMGRFAMICSRSFESCDLCMFGYAFTLRGIVVEGLK
jgi:hypothetical protein